MSNRRDIRRLAMQLLYQIDLTGGRADVAELLADLDEEQGELAVREAAAAKAAAAWAGRAAADAAVAALAPDWPTHRQPPVDRAILRLAHYEMTRGVVPAKVAVNEAVELAKAFAGEQSPAFINGVLDKLLRRQLERERGAAGGREIGDRRAGEQEKAEGDAEIPGDVWLDDALRGGRGEQP